MKKSPMIIITLIVIPAVVLIFFVPRSTPINHTLNAVKLDADGNEIGTVEIAMRGNKFEYLFQDDRIVLAIAPFDDLTSIQVSRDANGKEGAIYNLAGDYYALHFSAWDTALDDMTFCQLIFTEDFDCLAFFSHWGDKEAWYVASVSGNYTTEGIVEYFQGLVPGYQNT